MRFLIAFAIIVASHAATAGIHEIYGVPKRILNHSSLYGGCMVNLEFTAGAPLSQYQSDSGVACGDFYVSLDCAGTLGTSSKASQANYSAAQLAYVTGEQVLIELDSNKNVDGYCFGRRVDNFK